MAGFRRLLDALDPDHEPSVTRLLSQVVAGEPRFAGVSEVLVGNRQMLALTRELGFSRRPSPEDPGVRIVERKL